MGDIIYNGFKTLDLKLEKPNLLKTTPQLSSLQFPPLQLKVPESIANSSWYKMAKLKSDVNNIGKQWDQFKGEMQKQIENPNLNTGKNINKIGLGNKAIATGIDLATDQLSGIASNKLFGDSELGRGMGTLFSSGLSSAGNTITNNIIKGTTFADGLGKNAGASVAGATAGLAANYIGKGITSAMGDSKLARGIGQGVATGLGTVGGTVLGNLAKSGNILGNSSALFGSTANTLDKAGKITKYGAAINPYGLAMSVVGTGLGAAMGPSKEYGGKYGGITQGMDMGYDAIMAGINFVPGWGQIASGAMALNKGLSNIFGSTDGMTTQDAILGSAFMPAPVKWLNMWGSSTTSSFRNQSWQNSEKANSFMGNAFGNLGDKFDKAREEAGKTYGTFSQGAFKDAQDNINFANNAWNKVMAMADQNEIQNIRSQYMSSINNQRYAQQIGGAWQPIMRGKLGMKIFNNATNHNIGMRLLSGAALIDNKQMILCSAVD